MKTLPLIALTLGLAMASSQSLAHGNAVIPSQHGPLELSIDLNWLLGGHHRPAHYERHSHSPHCYRAYPRRDSHWARHDRHWPPQDRYAHDHHRGDGYHAQRPSHAHRKPHSAWHAHRQDHAHRRPSH